ncbi:unnamed protein product, partial [Pseudo-nitzschia multistriata]
EGTNQSLDQPQHYEGNVQLMEARFLQLCSSIRALYRSVQELRVHITEQRVGNGDNENDDTLVFLQAICENQQVLKKQRIELGAIVERMQRLNADTNLPDDIRIMVFDVDEENQREQHHDAREGERNSRGGTGLYL